MGDNISISQALIITAFSMVVVFLVLIVISILISGLKKIGKEEKGETEKVINASRENDKVLEEDQVDIIDDEELVAVISAAIAASMGVSIPELNIKKIKRIPQATPVWAAASRKEQMSGKL